MIHMILLDDHEEELMLAASLCQLYGQSKPYLDFVIHLVSDEEKFMQLLTQCPPPCIFLLDVLLPKINGIEIGECIRKKDKLSPIIYMTSSKDYAISSFKVRPLDYLMKPIKQESLFQALDDAIALVQETKTKSIVIKDCDGLHTVPCHLIHYVECKSHHFIYYLEGGTIIHSMTMRITFEEGNQILLQDPRFFKISASYIVNMSYVKHMDYAYLLMSDGAHLSVSRNLYSTCKKRYMSFLMDNTLKGA